MVRVIFLYIFLFLLTPAFIPQVDIIHSELAAAFYFFFFHNIFFSAIVWMHFCCPPLEADLSSGITLNVSH